MERLCNRSLDPLDPTARAGAPGFPDDLETTTIQGYLGEVMAGLIAETYAPHDREWKVPAFLFRGHQAAFQSLERARQQGSSTPKASPGRTGDDALAFEVSDDGQITAWLFGEAKCTQTHNSQLIRDGHDQLSATEWLPVDLPQLIDIMESKGDSDAQRWAHALRVLNWASEATAPPRLDMFVYLCGQRPKKNRDWITPDKPHDRYSGGKPLEAVEVHFEDFENVLKAAYPGRTNV